MTFVGVVALGIGSLLLWSALNDENPADVLASVLRGEPRPEPAAVIPLNPEPDPLAPVRPIV